VTYGEINARANRIANALIARGLQKGECVSTLMPNSIDQVALWFGILRAGGVQSPINLAYRGDFLSWVINLPQSRFLVISDDLLDRLVQADLKKKAMDEFLLKLRKKATLNYPDPSLRPATGDQKPRPEAVKGR
jgi:acyl-CoA synthetase (AMP-forming)/AMP-acid ligase II